MNTVKLKHLHKQKTNAFSLIEIVVSMIIINILIGVMIIAFKFAISVPSKKNIRLAVDLAANYLNEIMELEFPVDTPCPNYCNNNQNDQDQLDCVPNTKTRASYQNICDYHNLVDYGARDFTGQIISGLEKFKVYVKIITDTTVILGNLSGSNNIDDLKLVRIDVLVQRKNIPDILISAYRVRHK